MVRTQIYLTEAERDELAALAKDTGKKQSELIREAIDQFIERNRADYCQAVLNRTAGMWRDRQDLPDFQTIRTEWDRIISP